MGACLFKLLSFCLPSLKYRPRSEPDLEEPIQSPLLTHPEQLEQEADFQEDDYDNSYQDISPEMLPTHLPTLAQALPLPQKRIFTGEKQGKSNYTTLLKDKVAVVMPFENSSAATQGTLQNKRILNEVKLLAKLLPCEESNSIFVAINESNMNQMEAIIFGSEGTPYEGGAFLFKIQLPPEYPNVPPQVELITTGGGKIRFNPNLYENGYVCLSLLGTWRGEQKQNWQPNKSNIVQVLLSIQTLVMTELLFFNEPGYQDYGTVEYAAANNAYESIVRFGTVSYAMNEQLQNPPPHFKDIIYNHFRLKRNSILNTVYKWIQESDKEKHFCDHSLDHNMGMAYRYMDQPFHHKNDLIFQYNRLYENLTKLDPLQPSEQGNV